ncbi:P-loop containing nucleoside triphosphate hydrolase protein [Durotheca rogersii]|uniref:P-loop containing nucleoside triphosphate hydrolase protein n=1 Tax=Durotheca rogersii TaxID=419775 RepID=UPI00221FD5E3|nr:P-loop containing nucleoside triphosphate hydrolase protein [Durotheca rogersii]KAI5868158.1 P-loop containing nucleoside triphosphate hydrolase protein [Durotheca rogersii]
MPTAKRLKSGSQSKSRETQPRPTIADLEGESEFAQLARKHWLKPTRRTARVKVKNEVLKRDIWDVLEKDGFPYKLLLVLEGLQTLESYLWPGYSEDSSNFHVLLIVLITNVKAREKLETWGIFENRPAEFSSLFTRILSMSLDQTLSQTVRTHLLCFIIYAFQSLDWASVRKECAPLVSIGIWHNLSTESKRDGKLAQALQLRKTWKAAGKRYDSADDETKARLRFERAWLYTLVLDFLRLLYAEKREDEHVLYCERFVEFISDLLSQLPTRRYVNTLLQDLHVLPALRLSPMFNDEANGLLRDQCSLLSHYAHFAIDDQTGVQHSPTEAYDRHCADLAKLQRVSLQHFKDKLTVLALSNYGSIDQRNELENLLETLTDEEIRRLATLLELRVEYPESAKVSIDRPFLMEVLLSTYEKRKTFQEIARDMSIVPTEDSLFDQGLLRTDNYDGSKPLALPKLKLQYLSVGDFLWRALVLYRCEAFYGIRKDITDTLKRLRPESKRPGETAFAGISKMALSISRPSILEVVPALVGDDKPSAVNAEISLDVRRLTDNIRREWDSLRPDDVVFLVAVDASLPNAVSNGGVHAISEAQKLGLVSVRTAEIAQTLDDKGKIIRDPAAYFSGQNRSPTRKLQLRLDPRTYKEDMDRASRGKPDVYERINLVIRRSGRENNFKPVLESIRSLCLSEVPLASWLHENFLGYGDPAGATYKHLPNRIRRLDFRDTFLDWHHLVESLPGKMVEPEADVSSSFEPPYVLETVDKPPEKQVAKPSKKRRRGAEPALNAEIETYRVSTYKPPSTGPYPIDAPKLNSVRFTPAQIDAIISGTQPGLTVIVGPPGTGKTDVATQVINNIYHNFPEQRTLLIAHSNQALNQLFAKIVALDIDERHLLRLGHGEEDLDTDGNFSKHGRVGSFLEIRDRYLQEVNRLAASLGAPGAHGNSAETAGYFNSVYIQPAWAKFTEVARADGASAADIVQAFPFHIYFSDAPQPLFPPEGDRETVLDVANGCYRHISKIFSELEDVLPFEILRRDRDKANYLLTNEARIIAMTSTHAAMRRTEIASLGFHYDNVVMEEAAQITEVESFIPLAMQKPKNGQMALQRVVLCGDHYQNSPVIQSLAFRHYANLEQSLFSRFVRLGIPVITLDQQGRARPSIAALYQWRYPNLGNLLHVESQKEFQSANAGFKYEYQFINVPDYEGRGEAEPTPHFIHNVGEAEYAVAIYQYMRLLGYPASKISILATYAGQRTLIKEVLAHRCGRNAIFGLPKIVTTVDKYQGEQNDYIILSLTRTSRVGYLRDIRRLTVALSRARLGLYILGRREVFEACYELRPAFELLLQRPDKLVLATGEMWPSERAQAGEEGTAVPGEAVMEGVEHLGQFVYEMTATRIKQQQAERGQSEGKGPGVGDYEQDALLLEPVAEKVWDKGDDDDDDDDEADEGVGYTAQSGEIAPDTDASDESAADDIEIGGAAEAQQ